MVAARSICLNCERGQWQHCPQCNRLISKIEGCNHITCVCKYEFCYICRARWTRERCTAGCVLFDPQDENADDARSFGTIALVLSGGRWGFLTPTGGEALWMRRIFFHVSNFRRRIQPCSLYRGQPVSFILGPARARGLPQQALEIDLL